MGENLQLLFHLLHLYSTKGPFDCQGFYDFHPHPQGVGFSVAGLSIKMDHVTNSVKSQRPGVNSGASSAQSLFEAPRYGLCTNSPEGFVIL